MRQTITIPAHHAVTLLAALRSRREHRAAVLSFSATRAGLRQMDEAETALLKMEIKALDDAIAAVEVARSNGPAN